MGTGVVPMGELCARAFDRAGRRTWTRLPRVVGCFGRTMWFVRGAPENGRVVVLEIQ